MNARCIFVAICVVSIGLFACSGTSSDGDTTVQPDSTIGEDAPIAGDIPGEICQPQCDGKTCGDDGCQGSCGLCKPGDECVDGLCPVCEPDCAGKECGLDGCDGYCGDGDPVNEGCQPLLVCMEGLCLAVDPPDCEGKQCGPDGMEGSCGTCPCDDCPPDAVECNDAGACVEPPDIGCPEILECLNACPPADQACGENCINSATIEGQVIYNNLITCLQQAGYFECEEGDEECLEETFGMCISQYYECFHGDLPCVDMYLCIIDCPGGEAGTVCAQECFANGTVDALTTWDLFRDCLNANGYFDCTEGDEECLQAAWENCDEEFGACAHGDSSCSEMFDCLETCAPTDQMCGTSCLLHGTVEAQSDWESMVDCIVEQCGEEIDADCENSALEGACSGVYNACIGS